MKIIQVTRGITKHKAAELLGLKVFDEALPQQWLDETVVMLKMRKFYPIPEDFYARIVSGTV